MAATNSHQVTVKVLPWEDKGFKIDLLHIWEKVGENEPSGYMELSHDGNQDALDFITSQQTGKVEILDGNKGGQNLLFGFFITRREYVNNKIFLNFLIVPENDIQAGKNFYTRPRSENFDTLNDAIEGTWPGEIIKNIETDTGNTHVSQNNETGFSFFSRICYCWKFKSIFAFSWDGLVLKDIGPDKKAEVGIDGNAGLWYQKKETAIKYNSKNNCELFSPWTNDNKDNEESINKSTTGNEDYSEKEPKYVSSSISKDTYKIHKKGYDVVEKNFSKNSEFHGYTEIVITAQEMPKDWKIGDVVEYKRLDSSNSDKKESDIKSLRCVVAANEFFFSQSGASKKGPNGNPFEWTAILWGLDEFDVTKELQNNTNNSDEQ